MSDETFENQPESITELRATREKDATKWTPRDALVKVLRDIDAGSIAPENLVIVYDKPSAEDKDKHTFVGAYQNSLLVIGMLHSMATYITNRVNGQ